MEVLEERIHNDIKNALKEGRKDEVSSLRFAMNAINKKKKDEKADKIEDAKAVTVLQKLAKQHNESIVRFKEGGRDDLVEKEEKELSFIERYLPQPISDEELEKIVKNVIDAKKADSMKSMGDVIRSVMEITEGRADGGAISKKVRNYLS